MTQEDRCLVFERRFTAAPNSLFQAFVDPQLLRVWWCADSSVDPRPRGIVFLKLKDNYAMLGEIIELRPNRRLQFTWRGKDEPVATIVEIDLSPEGSETFLRLAHGGIPAHPSWDQQREVFRDIWRQALDALQSALEQTPDVFTNHPVIPDQTD